MGEISYGTTRISYVVLRRARATIGIEVHPDSQVVILAPHSASDRVIQARIEKRAPWITKQIRYFESSKRTVREREWISGENIYILGRQYRLKVLKGLDEVKLSGSFLKVSCVYKKDTDRIEALVNKWLQERAKLVFTKRLAAHNHILDKERIKMNQLMVRRIKNRWGSCTKKGNIVLNTELIHASTRCIDYVIVHELCHLKFHHHGPEFWVLLSKYSPDWNKRKATLESQTWL